MEQIAELDVLNEAATVPGPPHRDLGGGPPQADDATRSLVHGDRVPHVVVAFPIANAAIATFSMPGSGSSVGAFAD